MKPVIKCNDNLVELKKLPSGSVDLVYIDPPFFTQRNWGDFGDKWPSMDAYLDFIKPRIEQIHRVLKPTGSAYIHLNPRASHYVKVMADGIFGYDNFVNEIVWYNKQGYRNGTRFNRKHDTILLYAKGKDRVFNAMEIVAPPSASKQKEYSSTDEDGRKYRVKYGKRYYMHDDWIDDVIYNPPVQHVESLGYATQKPEKLVETFIKASSNPGGTVLDAFAGSGTTCAVANKLGRKSICVDINPRACKIMEERLK